MKLTKEEKSMLVGAEGPVREKVMNTLFLYGQALGAERFADIQGCGHFSIPFCMPGLGPRLEMLQELADAGMRTRFGFTLDPRPPLDFENLFISHEQEDIFRDLYSDQQTYDNLMLQLGLRDDKAYTCTPYFSEVGNIPARGEVLAWSESSCVVYANSVLGARTNRNAAVMDILSNLIGKTPLTGFLLDEGRQAHWRIEVNTSTLPNPQLLGAAIGMKVMEDVPFITGLERFLDPTLPPDTIDFLKEMGAACAAIGAVGLYHIRGVTPEAVEQDEALLRPDYQTYIIDDHLLEDMFDAYPVTWSDAGAEPQKCLIGCPHLSLGELHRWTEDIARGLKQHGRDRVAVDTVLCAAPQVIDLFRAEKASYDLLVSFGVRLSPSCPEAYMTNQSCAAEAVVTNSNKLRAFTPARMFLDRDLVQIIATGQVARGK